MQVKPGECPKLSALCVLDHGFVYVLVWAGEGGGGDDASATVSPTGGGRSWGGSWLG